VRVSDDHEIDIPHHHCVECGGLMTGASSIHPQCDLKVKVELEMEDFRQRRQKEDEEAEAEAKEADDRGILSRLFKP
jgi:hypothetical protein